jgi:SAM-dependent methyltransferase
MTTTPNNFQDATKTDFAAADDLWASEHNLPRYSRFVAKLMTDAIIGNKVMEFGAGIGTIAAAYTSLAGVRPDCLEIDTSFREILSDRGFHCISSIENASDTYDAIYSSNVLEHIEDDVGALTSLRPLIKRGGTLVLYVPASMRIYSDHDHQIGHYRRYEKHELVSKLTSAGYQVMKAEYVDCIGYFAWWQLKLHRNQQSSVSANPAQLKFFDRYVFPVSRALDLLGVKYLFGKNLYVVATPINR